MSTQFVLTADFNHDQIPDVAGADRNDLLIYSGIGDGTFTVPLRLHVGYRTIDVVAGDVNGDGDLDLIAAGSTNQTWSIFHGQADGSFGSAIAMDIGAEVVTQDLVTGDFNADGIADIASGNEAGITILIGEKTGDYQIQTIHQTTLTPGPRGGKLIQADLNGDGHADLAVTKPAPFNSGFAILFGNGDGTFDEPILVSTGFEGSGSPYSIATADFNQDGFSDLALGGRGSNSSNGAIEVWLGSSAGSLSPIGIFEIEVTPETLALGDLNADGLVDWITSDLSSSGNHGRSILFNLGNGVFGSELRLPETKAQSVAIADFNLDGEMDLVNDIRFGGFAIELGLGNGNFHGQNPTNAIPFWTLAEDFNSDGIADLATIGFGSDDVAILIGTGAGSFHPATRWPVGPDPISGVSADFNGDGLTDLLVTGNESVWLLPGIGDGTFETSRPVSIPAGSRVIAVEDFDDNGTRDLAVTNSLAGEVQIYRGVGDGTFDPAQAYAVGDFPIDIVIADIDGDGFEDLATVSLYDDSIAILRGDAEGDFHPPETYATGRFPQFLAIDDLNGDGHPDAIVSSSFPGSNAPEEPMTLLMNDGSGGFLDPVFLTLPSTPLRVATGDFNHDGLTDIASTNQFRGEVSLSLGTGSGLFANAQIFAIPWAESIAVADFDQDGIDDLAVTVAAFDSLVVGFGQPVSLLPGDANGDGVVNLLDLDILGQNWQTSGATVASGDFNGDSDVNLLDLDILGQNWNLGTASAAVVAPPTQSAKVTAVRPGGFTFGSATDLDNDANTLTAGRVVRAAGRIR